MGYIKLTRYKHYNSFSLGGWGDYRLLCVAYAYLSGGLKVVVGDELEYIFIRYS